ncbi:hypothetical protein [Chondromyces crocatus]|uniref:Uncharacterized protein n=1 Tax=Chondromyces crocatus TaxID=52 RepID=A0A0K1ECF7_CHOCO|nr:hypothetical protein [Chondromyces crocatus]AKT38253.1 uncharacterized protein CMC5_023960 [Chondromyces crocatus]
MLEQNEAMPPSSQALAQKTRGAERHDEPPDTARPPRRDTQIDDLQTEIDAELAKLAEVETRRAQREHSQRLVRELAEAKRARKEAEVIERLEAEHGPLDKRILRIDTDEGMIVVRKPDPRLYQRFVDQGKTNTEALSKLVRPHVVYPDKTELTRIFEEVPAALMRCADAVCFLAGVRKQEAEGK